MSADQLREATRALRAGTQARNDADRAEETRRRIMASLQGRRVAKLRRIRWLLPIAAVLVTSSAFAASRPEVTAAIRAAFEPEAAPVRNATFVSTEASSTPVVDEASNEVPAKPTNTLSTASAIAAPTERTEPSVDAHVSTIEDPPRDVPVARSVATSAPPALQRPASAPPSVAPEKTAPVEAEGEDPAIRALYLAAHQKHFVARDPAGALAAWDAYLSAAPKGRMATEARYNRALCLARLGRASEARSALEPFAEGQPGSYRQSEARSLVEALGEP